MKESPRGPVDWARHYAALRESGEHPLLTAREARDLVDQLGTELYRAQDAHAFVGEMCAIEERKQDGAPWPWMRLSLNSQDVILHARQVREVYESMGAWLEQVDGRSGKPCCGKDVGHYPGCAVNLGEAR